MSHFLNFNETDCVTLPLRYFRPYGRADVQLQVIKESLTLGQKVNDEAVDFIIENLSEVD